MRRMNIRICFIARSPYFTGLLPFLLLGTLLSGCGKKSFPKPVTQELPPQIQDLRVQVQPKGVELSWSLPDQIKSNPQGSGYRFAILRSELAWENRSCVDCPPSNQQEIQRIDPAFPQSASIDSNRIVWVDTAVSPHHAYRYQVIVQNEKGRPVTFSNMLTAKVITPPEGIKKLGASRDPQGILLGWKASNKDQKGKKLSGDLQYTIERHAPNGSWEVISQVPIKAQNFLDSAVASNQSYDYRVTPFVVFEETRVLGEPAVIQNVLAPEALPPPPPGTVWVIPAKGALEVQWTPSDGKVGGYYVYRKEGKEIIRLTETPVKNPPYVDRSVKPNAVYFYAVSSVSAPPEQREGLLSKWAEIRNLIFQQ